MGYFGGVFWGGIRGGCETGIFGPDLGYKRTILGHFIANYPPGTHFLIIVHFGTDFIK